MRKENRRVAYFCRTRSRLLQLSRRRKGKSLWIPVCSLRLLLFLGPMRPVALLVCHDGKALPSLHQALAIFTRRGIGCGENKRRSEKSGLVLRAKFQVVAASNSRDPNFFDAKAGASGCGRDALIDKDARFPRNLNDGMVGWWGKGRLTWWHGFWTTHVIVRVRRGAYPRLWTGVGPGYCDYSRAATEVYK